MGLASMVPVSNHQMARISAIVTKDGMVLNAMCQVGLFVVCMRVCHYNLSDTLSYENVIKLIQ